MAQYVYLGICSMDTWTCILMILGRVFCKWQLDPVRWWYFWVPLCLCLFSICIILSMFINKILSFFPCLFILYGVMSSHFILFIKAPFGHLSSRSWFFYQNERELFLREVADSSIGTEKANIERKTFWGARK